MARKYSIIKTADPALFHLVEFNPEAVKNVTKEHKVILAAFSEGSLRAHLAGHHRLADTDMSGFMSNKRYNDLQEGIDNATLTPQEQADGWFFDDEFDGLLANRAWAGHEKDRGY